MGVRIEKVYLRAGVCMRSPSLVFHPPSFSLFFLPCQAEGSVFGWRGEREKNGVSHTKGEKKGKGGEYKNLWCVKDEGKGECRKKAGAIAPCKMGANILLLFGKRLRGEVFAGEEGGGEDKRRRRRKRKRVWIVKCIFLSD